MEVKDYSVSSSLANVSNSIQEFFNEKMEGLNIVQRIMLGLYVLMTFLFFASALFFVFTKGFKN